MSRFAPGTPQATVNAVNQRLYGVSPAVMPTRPPMARGMGGKGGAGPKGGYAPDMGPRGGGMAPFQPQPQPAQPLMSIDDFSRSSMMRPSTQEYRNPVEFEGSMRDPELVRQYDLYRSGKLQPPGQRFAGQEYAAGLPGARFTPEMIISQPRAGQMFGPVPDSMRQMPPGGFARPPMGGMMGGLAQMLAMRGGFPGMGGYGRPPMPPQFGGYGRPPMPPQFGGFGGFGGMQPQMPMRPPMQPKMGGMGGKGGPQMRSDQMSGGPRTAPSYAMM